MNQTSNGKFLDLLRFLDFLGFQNSEQYPMPTLLSVEGASGQGLKARGVLC